jgi:hypothetical protein
MGGIAGQALFYGPLTGKKSNKENVAMQKKLRFSVI